jgi:iron(III) transport system substrate-binding protein
MDGTGVAVARQDAPAPSAAAPHQSPEVQRLLAAARDNGETELGVAWCECSLGGGQGAKLYEALFNRMYGTNVRVNFSPAVSMTEMAAKVAQEAAVGQKASTDILLGTDTHFGALLDRDVLEAYDYSLLSPRIRKEMVAVGNIGVQIAGSGIAGIAVNTDLVSPADVPKRLEDVLHPKWKGVIAAPQNAAYLDRVAMRPEWGADRMRAFVSRLSEHVGGLIVTGEMGRIISGEFLMLVLGGHTQVVREKARGAPLAFVIPEDAAVVAYLHLGVPRTAAHPNLSKLFINTVLTEEGQRIAYEREFTDHPDLPGSQSAAELNELKARGIRPLSVDVQFQVEHPELRGLADDLVKILREKGGS